MALNMPRIFFLTHREAASGIAEAASLGSLLPALSAITSGAEQGGSVLSG